MELVSIRLTITYAAADAATPADKHAASLP
jgi:hypothetical protein